MATTPEILPVQDRTHVQNQSDNTSGTWSKVAQEAYSFVNSSSVGRELNLLGQGVVWGAIKEGKDAFTNHTKSTLVNLAETVGIGAAIAVAAKAGPMPLKLLAAGAGAYFGYQMQDWVKGDVLNADRWKSIGSSMSDAWQTNAHMDRNLQVMQKNAGLLAFDSTLMLGGGALGAKLGSVGVDLGSRMDMSSLKIGRPVAALEAVPVAESVHLGADVKKVDTTDPFYKADQIVKAKKGEISKHGLEGLSDLMRESKMRDLAGKDETTRNLRDVQMPELVRQNAELQKTINGLGTDLQAKHLELKAAETLSSETRNLRDAEARLAALQESAAGLGAKRAELGTLDDQIKAEAKAKEDRKKHGGASDHVEKKGKGDGKAEDEAAPQVDIRERARELRKEIAEITAANDTSKPNSEINQSTRARDAAQEALTTAQQQQAALVEGLQGEVSGIQGQIDAHTETRAQLATQMQGLVDSYYGRLSELMADPTVLKMATGIPVEEVKTVKPAQTAKPARVEQRGASNDRTAGQRDRTGRQQQVRQPEVARETKAASTTDGNGTGKVEVKTDAVPEVKKEAIAPEEMARLDAAGKAKVALDNATPLVNEARERLQAIDRATNARKQAREQLDSATKQLAEIESGKKTFADETAKTQATDELTAKQQKARQDMEQAQEAVRKVGSGQYFQAMRGIRRYAGAVEDYLAKETDSAKRFDFAKQAATNLEDLMDGLPKSRQGTRPPMDNLSRRGFTGKEMERISQIGEHLDKRLEQMDNKHDARLSRVANMTAVKAAFDQVNSGQLRTELPDFIKERLADSQNRILTGEKPEKVPARNWTNIQDTAGKVDLDKLASDAANVDAVLKESTVVFFDQQGKLIGHVGTDNKFRPKYFDVTAIMNGPGRGGAGIDRLLGENPVGYAVLGPKARLSFGGRMELHQIGTNSKGAPVFNKEVITTGGKVPESVTRGTPANRLSNTENRSGQRRGNRTGGDGSVAQASNKPESAA